MKRCTAFLTEKSVPVPCRYYNKKHLYLDFSL